MLTRSVFCAVIVHACAGLCIAQDYRVFLARDGEQDTQPTTGTTLVTMHPGETATIMMWFEDLTGTKNVLNAYQAIVQMDAEPIGQATGTIRYVDNDPGMPGGNSVWLDSLRDDWVFAEEPVTLDTTYNETPDERFFGMFYATIPGLGTSPAGKGILYAMQFQATASIDACGDFLLKHRVAPKNPPLSAFFTPTGTSFGVPEWQHVIVRIEDCDNPCTGPCDDGDVCTIDDELCGEVCAGQPIVCSGTGNECLAASCNPGGADGNCDVLTPINEGQYCNWTDGVCTDGTCVEPPAGNVRVFMAPEGLHRVSPPLGPTYYLMMPGETVRLMAWVEDSAAGELLGGYQVVVPMAGLPADDATGTVTYVDLPGAGDTIAIDALRSDWVYAGMMTASPEYVENTKQDYVSAAYLTPMGQAVDPGATGDIGYLCEFELAASPDSSGTFEFPFRLIPAPGTGLLDPTGGDFAVNEYQPLIIVVGAPQPLFGEPPNGGTDPTGGPDVVGDQSGRDYVILYLNGPAAALQIEDFAITVSGGIAPVVEEIIAEDTVATVRFDRPIPAGHCTLIKHIPSGWYTTLRSLPGDINGDGISNPSDIITLIDHLNGVLDTPLADWQCDIDQSGACNGLDILAEIDLLNGGDGGMAWNGVEVPECP